MFRTFCTTLVLLTAGLAARPAGAQAPAPAPYEDRSAIPDRPAYRRARELVALINDGDSAKVRAYVEAGFAEPFRSAATIAERLDAFAEMGDLSGRYTIHSARHYTPPRPDTAAVLVVWNERLETWEAAVVEVEARAPHRVTAFRMSPARPPSDIPAAPALTDAEVAARVGACVDRLAARDLFSGAVLLAKDGKPFLTRAAGVANRDFDAPVKLDTKFNLGSMNKMFTGIAVMQLAAQGRLSLDDPIGRWLSEDWLPRPILDRVRVKHLLTHTSGLGDYFTETFVRSSRALYRRVEDYRPLVHGDSLLFEPGTGWSYSNAGMLLAGAIVEKASGQDYFDYVREHIAGPAGMTATDCYELDRVNPNLAVGYDRRRDHGRVVYENNLFKHVLRGGPAGGGYSTAEDLLRFDRALRSGKLLDPEPLAQAWRTYPELGSDDYGLGFGVGRSRLGRVVGHSGGFAGISAYFDMYLDSGYTIVVLTNLGGAAPLVADKARSLLEQGR